MKKYLVNYIFNIDEPERVEEVTAASYTQAYLYIIFKFKNPIIINVKEI